MDLAMGSGAIGFSNGGIAGVSVNFAMLCYRQSEEKSAKAPLTQKQGLFRGTQTWEKCSDVCRKGRGAELPVFDAPCSLVSKVHSQGERHVQHGRLIVLTGHVRA
jgi:hypothetical protein